MDVLSARMSPPFHKDLWHLTVLSILSIVNTNCPRDVLMMKEWSMAIHCMPRGGMHWVLHLHRPRDFLRPKGWHLEGGRGGAFQIYSYLGEIFNRIQLVLFSLLSWLRSVNFVPYKYKMRGKSIWNIWTRIKWEAKLANLKWTPSMGLNP